ncbi:MAG: PTS sugar transporter subunit IIA [Deltaproteobacteria bacterium]|nr:PTS sugar transporter subunit IIA [Candidatus Anaeroferrophillus wilburensis]MBN2889327.1 PTS sugar transporter subunit IIA [Deltaproteobacteria bacterium]
MNTILAVSILVAAGLFGGMAARRLRLPSVTGNIVIGVAIGPHLLNILSHDIVYQTLQPISEIALSLIAVSIASHLRINRMAGHKFRLLVITLFQVAGAFAAVFLAACLLLESWIPALLLATIAVSTAPAATLAVVKETEARGPLVKTLISVVALDNVLAITLFVVVSFLVEGELLTGHGISLPLLTGTCRVIGLSLLLGAGVSAILLLLSKGLREKYHFVTCSALAVFFTTGISSWLNISPLLPNMTVGFLISNLSPQRREILNALEDLEPLIYLSFFTLAGTHLDISLLPGLGVVGVVYILTRYGGKLAGAWFGGWLTNTVPLVRNNLGFCLVPQAGVAIGLVVAMQDNQLFHMYESSITAIVLASIVISELSGPVIVKQVLSHTGEAGQEGRRLFGIVPRRGIVTPLAAVDKWAVIEELVDYAMEIHSLHTEQRHVLLASVIEREKSLSTGIGKGIAIPHGTISKGRSIMGVLGIKPAGVDFQSLDGEKSKIIILMLIPEGCFRDHLRVLAEISKVMSRPGLVERLVETHGAEKVYHILFTEEINPGDYLVEEEMS